MRGLSFFLSFLSLVTFHEEIHSVQQQGTSAESKPLCRDLTRPARSASCRGLSGSHSYFGLGAPCRSRADPAHLWMCGQDGSQCSAGLCVWGESVMHCDGICDRVRERDCWLGLWGVWLDYSWSCRLAETEDLGLLVSCAVKPTFTSWPAGSHPASTEPGSWLHCAAPCLSFWAFASFPSLSFSEFMCLPSAEISGEKGYQSPGILSTSAHVPFLLLPPHCLLYIGKSFQRQGAV